MKTTIPNAQYLYQNQTTSTNSASQTFSDLIAGFMKQKIVTNNTGSPLVMIVAGDEGDS